MAPAILVEPALAGFDVLRLPFLGPFLRWRHARLAVAARRDGPRRWSVIADGLFGTQVAAMNLAGVLPWIHWRGFLVLGLLAAGNVSCMACPFLVPRTLARRWLPAGSAGRGGCASKWPSVVLLAPVLLGVRGVRPLGQPAVDGLDRDRLFRGGLRRRRPVSRGVVLQVPLPDRPVQLRAVADFAAGGEGPRPAESATPAGRRTASGATPRRASPAANWACTCRGRAGNLDCTFCLDCVHACPHDNVGILAVAPGHDLWNETHHSGIGRLQDRPDVAALILVLVFAAFANAAGMTGPVLAWQERLAAPAGAADSDRDHHGVLPLRAPRSARVERRSGDRPEPAVGPRRRAWRRRRGSRMPWSPWASACGWRTTVITC